MPNQDSLDWLSTDGGPFLVVPKKHIEEWKGANEGSIDYDRACNASEKGQIAVIPVGSGQGLVYGEGEEQTAWFPLNEDNTDGVLVWWVFAESKEEAASLLTEIPESTWKNENLIFTNDDLDMRIIGSADSGKGDIWGSLEFNLKPGRYSIYSADYKPNEHTFLILYRLKKED